MHRAAKENSVSKRWNQDFPDVGWSYEVALIPERVRFRGGNQGQNSTGGGASFDVWMLTRARGKAHRIIGDGGFHPQAGRELLKRRDFFARGHGGQRMHRIHAPA